MSRITDIFRNMLLNELTGNLGKVEVTDEEIICYVDKKKIGRKYDKKNCVYRVDFSSTKILTTELLNKYGINKPVRYIVDGIRFGNKLFFSADEDTSVLFRGCKFHKQIRIEKANKVFFENNKYYDRYPVYAYKNKFLSGRAKFIQFTFDNFVNSGKDYPTQFGMDIIVNNLNVISSNIDIKESNQDSCIMADKIAIINSQMSCPSIYLLCDDIDIISSKIVATDGIMIDEKNCDKNSSNIIDSIESPSITYNGVEQQRISDEEIAKKYHRMELIKELRRIRNNCIIENEKKLEEERKNLNQKTIGQIKR